MRRFTRSKNGLAFISAIFLLLLLSGSNTFAQTNICGFQPGVRFTLAGSPYRLTCSYTIPVGDSLVVEPGVRLDLGSYPLTVNGKLRLRGTPADSVFVTNASPGSYAGITFQSTGTGSIVYASFRNFQGTALTLLDGTATRVVPVVANVRFAGNGSDIDAGINTTAGLSNLAVRPVRLRQSTSMSGRLAAYGPVSAYQLIGSLTVPSVDSLVVDPGVRLDLNSHPVLVNGKLRLRGTPADSVFVTNASPGSYAGIVFQSTGTGSITYTRFRNFQGTALTLLDGSIMRVPPVVANSRFAGNGVDIEAGINTTTGLRNLAVRPVRLRQSTSMSGRLVAYGPVSGYVLTGSLTVPSADSVVIEPGVLLDLGSYPLTVNGKLHLRGTQQDSVFVTNASPGSYAGITFQSTGTGSITYTRFRNFLGTALTLLDGSSTRVSPVVANSRFANNGIDISAGINTTSGLLNLVVKPVQLRQSTNLSGRLVAYGPVSAYILTGSLTVPSADSVVVEPGVRLDLGSYPLTVMGTLHLRGTQQDSVFITNASPGSYAGITIESTGTGSIVYTSFRNFLGTPLTLLNGTGQNISRCHFHGTTGIAVTIPSSQTLLLESLKFVNFQTAMAVSSGSVTVVNSLFGGLAPRFGINATGTSSVVATSCNFGHTSGPYNLSRNPSGLGCQISNNVCLSLATTPVAGFDFVIYGNDVAFVNTSTNASSYSWAFGNGTTSTLANPLQTLPIGSYNVCLTAGVGNVSCTSAALCKPVSILGLASITTNHGGNTGAVSVVVKGGGFVPNMQLFLRKAGQTDILGDTVITRSLGEMTTGFDLTGKAIGQWDVVAIYPNGTTVSLPNGFTIEAGTAPNLWVSIAGPAILRIGFQQVFTVTYGNDGNTDAVIVPLFIRGLPRGTEIEVLDSLFHATSIPGYDTLSIMPLDSLRHTNLDTISNLCFRMIYIRRIQAGSTGSFSVIFRLPATTSLLGTIPLIKVSISAPALTSVEGLYRGGNRASYSECLQTAVKEGGQLALDYALDKNNWLSCGHNARTAASDVSQYFATHPTDRSFMDGVDVTWSAVSAVGSCVEAVAGVMPVGRAVKIARTVIDLMDKASTSKSFGEAVGKIYEACKDIFPPEDEDQASPTIRGASDPNAKYGPGAGSNSHFINKERPLAYSIAFENTPTATLNAQTVRVTDTLAAQAFELASFLFTSVTLSEQTYALPAPAKSFVHDFDFVAQHGVKARVIGTYDGTTGIVRWTIFSIDPATNQVTTNALAGFLPPNTISPQGQGYVSFIVKANSARQTGDIIRNRASIVFDFNPPILTNSWHNTFDLARPVSAINSAVPAQPNTLRVTWSGSDTGSGIRSYDIHYTTNGRYSGKWLAGTSLTTDLFTGVADSTYCFFSVARDSANNVEVAPTTPDACQRVPLGMLASTQHRENFKVYPNPSTGKFTLESYCRKSESTILEIVTVLGSTVYHQKVTLSAGVQNREIDISNLPAGVYFLRLQTSEGMVVKKLIKN